MAAGGGEPDDLLQVAWLYHVGQLSQEEVSRRLGMSRFKVLRLLAEARERGLVRVALAHGTVEALDLAGRLAARFGLMEAQVAPLPEGASEDQARRAVGIVAAALLRRLGGSGEGKTVGVGWGRTLAAMADAVTGLRNPGLRFVALMGSMARASGTGPLDIVTRLAAATGASALVMPAPFLCDSAADAGVVRRQRLVRETLEAARAADHAIVSVGECSPEALLFTSGVLTEAEAAALLGSGAVADTTGLFFRADGSLAPTGLDARVLAVGIEDLRATDVTLLAAGRGKAAAAGAVLRSGLVDRLVACEPLARALLGEAP